MAAGRSAGDFLLRAAKLAVDPRTVAYTTAGFVAAKSVLPAVASLFEQRLNRRISQDVPNPLPPAPLYGLEYKGRPLRLLVLGDSLAAGATAVDPASPEWPEAVFPAELAQAVADHIRRPVELLAMANVGDQHQHLGSQLHATALELTSRNVVRPRFDVDLALIIAGSNDVRDVRFPTSWLVDSPLRNCITSLHTKFGAPDILIAGCPLPTTAPVADHPLVRLALNGRAEKIRNKQLEVVGDFMRYGGVAPRVHFVAIDDITTGLRGKDGMFAPYDIHPNGEGQKFLVRELVKGKVGEVANARQVFSGNRYKGKQLLAAAPRVEELRERTRQIPAMLRGLSLPARPTRPRRSGTLGS